MSLTRILSGGNRKEPGHADIVEKGWIKISNTAHIAGKKYNFGFRCQVSGVSSSSLKTYGVIRFCPTFVVFCFLTPEH